MELFLPSLMIIVVMAFFAFLVIPRTGPMILAAVSLVALIAAGIHHYKMFYSEYYLSTWQNGLAAYAPFVILGLAILFIIAAIFYMFSGGETKSAIANAVSTPMEAIQEVVSNSVANMPPASTATNPLTAAINKGINAAANVVGNTGPAPVANRPVNRPPNRPANALKSPNIPGLGFPPSAV
jgi:hypothetical protein